jgi:hypothetical protein
MLPPPWLIVSIPGGNLGGGLAGFSGGFAPPADCSVDGLSDFSSSFCVITPLLAIRFRRNEMGFPNECRPR